MYVNSTYKTSYLIKKFKINLTKNFGIKPRVISETYFTTGIKTIDDVKTLCMATAKSER